MSTQERKMSLSDRFGTIKQTPTLHEKVLINSDLVKRLQLKISDVVRSREGSEVVESLADKIGKEELECRPQRADNSLNVESSKFQNIKVQVTLNAKRFSEPPANKSTFDSERCNKGTAKESSMQSPGSKTFHNQQFLKSRNRGDESVQHSAGHLHSSMTVPSNTSSKGIFNTDHTHSVANEANGMLHHKTNLVTKISESDLSKAVGNSCCQKDLELQQCFPTHLHSETFCKLKSDDPNSDYKSPLENNYIQPVNNYGNIPYTNTKTDVKYETPYHYQQRMCYKDKNVAPGHANHHSSVLNASSENKVQHNGRFHSAFSDRAVMQANFENYHNQALRVSPNKWHNKTPEKMQNMHYRNFSRVNFESQNRFKFTSPNHSKISETEQLHQSIDTHTRYYGNKRRSPFKPDRMMIPAKKRMINEYFNQISDQSVNGMEHGMPVANQQDARINHALFAHDPGQGVFYERYTENLNTGVQQGNKHKFSHNNGQLDYVKRALNMDETSCKRAPIGNYEADTFDKTHSFAATKEHIFSEMFLKEKYSEQNNRPKGFYRELAKENQSPEKEFQTIYDARRNGSQLKQHVDTTEVKEKLVDTLLMQCQGLVEKENDKKALETIFSIIKKETSMHFSETDSSIVDLPNFCRPTENRNENQDNIEMSLLNQNESDKSKIRRESQCKELDDSLLKKQNSTSNALDKISYVQSKFSPTLSSPDYYAKPNSSMKFEGRTLLKGGVDPRHIPKNVIEKFLKNPPLDPRGNPKLKKHCIDLPLPLFFVEFVAGVKEKKSGKDLSMKVPKKMSVKLSKSENESSVKENILKSENRRFSSKAKAELVGVHCKSGEDNKTVDNFDVIEMEIDEIEKTEISQNLTPKATESNPNIFDPVDLVLQAAGAAPKPKGLTSGTVQRSELKPCDPRLNVCSKSRVNNSELKTLKYNTYPDGGKVEDASTPNGQSCRVLSCESAGDNENNDYRQYEETNNVKYQHSRSISPKRSLQRQRTFSRDCSKSGCRDDPPKYRSYRRSVDKMTTKYEQQKEATASPRTNGKANPCPRSYSPGYSPHAPKPNADSVPYEDISRCRKEWSGEVTVVETRCQSGHEKNESSFSKKDSSELKDLSPDTCKFIRRRENDRKRLLTIDYRRDESRGKFRHEYQGNRYIEDKKSWTPRHTYR